MENASKPPRRQPGERLALRLAAVCCALLLTACRSDEPPPKYETTIDVSRFIRALGSDDPFESDTAVDELAALGPSVIPTLEVALQREPVAVRCGIVEVLEQLGTSESSAILLRTSRDPADEVRAESLLALGTLADERGRDEVEAALSDPNPDIQRAAAAACASLCDSDQALQRVVEIAMHARPFGRMTVPRETLRRILRHGSSERSKATRQAIEKAARPRLRQDAGQDERVRAALLLSDLQDPEALPWLIEAVEKRMLQVDRADRPLMKIQAILALGSIGNDATVDVLRQIARRQPGPLHEVACQALQQLADRRIKRAAPEPGPCARERRRDSARAD